MCQGVSVKDTPFIFITWDEYKAGIFAFAKSLIALDVKPHKIINIMGFNAVRKQSLLPEQRGGVLGGGWGAIVSVAVVVSFFLLLRNLQSYHLDMCGLVIVEAERMQLQRSKGCNCSVV